MNPLIEKWRQLPPEDKQKYAKFTFVGVVVLTLLSFYVLSGEGERRETAAAEARKDKTERPLDTLDLMAKDVSQAYDNRISAQDKNIDSIAETQKQTDLRTERIEKGMLELQKALTKLSNQQANQPSQVKKPSYIELPNAKHGGYRPPSEYNPKPVHQVAAPPATIGKIGRATGMPLDHDSKKNATSKKSTFSPFRLPRP